MKKANPEDRALCELVDAFASEMKNKLMDKRAEGQEGWRVSAYRGELHQNFRIHATGDMNGFVDFIDVANFAAFLWNLDGRPEST